MFLTADHNRLHDLLLAAGWLEQHQTGCWDTRVYTKHSDMIVVDLPESDVYETCDVHTDFKMSEEMQSYLQLTPYKKG